MCGANEWTRTLLWYEFAGTKKVTNVSLFCQTRQHGMFSSTFGIVSLFEFIKNLSVSLGKYLIIFNFILKEHRTPGVSLLCAGYLMNVLNRKQNIPGYLLLFFSSRCGRDGFLWVFFYVLRYLRVMKSHVSKLSTMTWRDLLKYLIKIHNFSLNNHRRMSDLCTKGLKEVMRVLSRAFQVDMQLRNNKLK